MPRIRFVEDFDWKPKASVTVAYRKGDELVVTTACARAAAAAGKGVPAVTTVAAKHG